MSINKMPPWSYTALDTFETCPKQYFHRYVLKEKSPETEAMRHGTEVHSALENRLLGKALPEPYKKYEPICASILSRANYPEVKLFVELPLAIDRDFKPCGFFDKHVWGRGKADTGIKDKSQVWVGDWKTGKTREKEFQVKVFGAFMFKMFPDVTHITANNIWLQEGKIGQTYVYNKRDEPAMWNEIIHKINRIETAFERGTFDPKPSGLCGWCDVKTCPHNTSELRKFRNAQS